MSDDEVGIKWKNYNLKTHLTLIQILNFKMTSIFHRICFLYFLNCRMAVVWTQLILPHIILQSVLCGNAHLHQWKYNIRLQNKRPAQAVKHLIITPDKHGMDCCIIHVRPTLWFCSPDYRGTVRSHTSSRHSFSLRDADNSGSRVHFSRKKIITQKPQKAGETYTSFT
jgi:hypothetical protein